MPIVRSGETEFDKEMQKWELPKSQGGMNADGYEPFPKMLYMAHRRENGKVMCMDMDALYAVDMATVARAEAFNRACQLTVRSQSEMDRAVSDGWRTSPKAALEHQEALAREIAQAAAEEAYRVKSMGEKSRAEYAAHDESTDAPATEVPVPVKAPKRTRVQVA